jgi:WD40 repeat protein
MTEKPIRKNPYVGPRALQDGEKIYGRTTETYNLLDLLIANRIVLLHSPSGAGKSSLVNAGLTPLLRDEGFTILGPVRVNLEPPQDMSANENCNRYVLSVLLGLEEHLPQAERSKIGDLACKTIEQYLIEFREKHADASSLVLIFDQFEEILTVDPTGKDAKMAFFNQVGSVLRNQSVWALFVAREDYIAAFEPYLLSIPTRLHNTFRLDFLGVDAATRAVRKPVEEANIGVQYTDEAVTKLVNDLRTVQVQLPDGSTEPQPGLYIEPVQLQVVCRHLINHLSEGTVSITLEDITDVGDVNESLAQYYQEQVEAVSKALDIPERRIREWFGNQLITKQGIRGLVQMGKTTSGDLENKAIRMLVSSHLVRAEKRLNSIWYELAHDRMITPVRENNAVWVKKNLNLLQRQTEVWLSQGRASSLLLRGEELARWQKWALDNPDEVIIAEQQFLEKSLEREEIRKERAEQQERENQLKLVQAEMKRSEEQAIAAQKLAQAEMKRSEEQAIAARKLAEEKTRRVEEQNRSAKKLRAALLIVAILAIAAVAFAGLSLIQQQVATIAKDAAERQERTAIAAKNEADYARSISDGLRETAQASELVAQQQAAIALDEKIKAEEERQKAEEARVGALRAQVDAEEQRSLALEAKSEADKQLNARSQGLAQVAESILSNQYELSLLLGIEAHKIADTVHAWDILLEGLQYRLSRADQLYYEQIGDFSMNHFAFSQNGRYLIWGTMDGGVTIFDVVEKSEIEQANLHEKSVTSVAVCKTGETYLIASGGAEGRIFLWKYPSEEPVQIDRIPELVRSLSFKPGCSQLAATAGAYLSFYNIDPDGSRVEKTKNTQYEAYNISVNAWSPDGSRLATGNVGNQVHIYEPEKGGKTNFKFLNREVTGLSWHPDGERLFTIHKRGVIELWNTRTGQIQEPFPIRTKSPTGFMAVSPDGLLIAVADSSENLEIYNTLTGQRVALLNSGFAGNMSNRMAFGLLNGRLLLAHSTYNSLLVSEIFMEQNLNQLVGEPTPAVSIGFDYNRNLLAANGSDRNIEIFDAASGETLTIVDVPDESRLTSVAFAPVNLLQPGADRVIAGTEDGNIYFLDFKLDTGSLPAHMIQNSDTPIIALAPRLSKPGAILSGKIPYMAAASCGEDTHPCNQIEIRVYSSLENPADSLLTYAAAAPVHLALNADGNLLAAGSPLRLWNLSSGDPEPIVFNEIRVTSLSFFKDNLLAFTTNDRELMFLDLSSLDWENRDASRTRFYGKIEGFMDEVIDLQYSLDGFLYSLEANGRFTRWLIRSEDLVNLACQAANRNMSYTEWGEYFPGQEYQPTCPQLPYPAP